MTYRRKTGWVPQAEREFALEAEQPERLDRVALVDLFLFMIFAQDHTPRSLVTRSNHPSLEGRNAV